MHAQGSCFVSSSSSSENLVARSLGIRTLHACLAHTQATVGDVEGSQPWAVQVEGRAKWDAWATVKGMTKEAAMEAYVPLACSLCVLLWIVNGGERGA